MPRYNGLPVVSVLATCLSMVGPAQGQDLLVSAKADGVTELRAGDGQVFHETDAVVSEEALIDASRWSLWIATWKETDSSGRTDPFYAISTDGVEFEARRTSYTIGLGGVARDPLVTPPEVPDGLRAAADNRLFIVQFHTHALEEYREAVIARGGKLHQFVGGHSFIVELDPQLASTVASLPFVRAVEPFHPAYRLASLLDEQVASPEAHERYFVRLFDAGSEHAATVELRIESVGGIVIAHAGNGRVLQAMLTREILAQVAAWNEVASISRWTEASIAMDNARAVSGVAHINTIRNFDGQGVRGEMMDFRDPFTAHLAFDPAIATMAHHDATYLVYDLWHHATNSFGTMFGNGSGAPFPDARGMIPAAERIYADFCRLPETAGGGECADTDDGLPPSDGDTDRYDHACQLVTETGLCCDAGDSNCPYRAVFQSNSWGNNSSSYLSLSRDLDEMVFVFDLLTLQAFGNSQTGRKQQAWAKNVVSVGGVRHWNTPDKSEHSWGPSGTGTGPAADGRIKPELIHFRDQIVTTTAPCYGSIFCCTNDNNQDYFCGYGGTSAAAPMTAGVFGLLLQIWHEGVFTVCDQDGCEPSGGGCSAFDTRPRSTTAKAMVMNTAFMYPIGSGPLQDIARENQGWGLPDIGRAYLMRHSLKWIVNETKVLTEGQWVDYTVTVPANTHALRATLVYRDPPGQEGCGQPPAGPEYCRVNDLTLRVSRQPGGPFECYLGNHGVLDGDWSTALTTVADCNPLTSPYRDTINTVENVFIHHPAASGWTIRVRAIEVNEDGRVEFINDDPSECAANRPPGCYETSPMDVNFALVVSLDMDCNQNGVSDADDIRDLEESLHGLQRRWDPRRMPAGARLQWQRRSRRV